MPSDYRTERRDDRRDDRSYRSSRDDYRSSSRREDRRDERRDDRHRDYRSSRRDDRRDDRRDERRDDRYREDRYSSRREEPRFIEAPQIYQKDAYAAPLSEEERGRPRVQPEGKKSRWGNENERVNIPGLPTSLPSDLTNDQIENYIIHMRIEEIGRKLRVGDYIPLEKRSVSPEPTYGEDGKRNNTRDLRYRKKFEDERHALVELGMKTILGFRPPADYKRPSALTEKLYIPQQDYPDINFIGLLIGPRGNTLKKMESETGTKISIRGKGSVKEGKTGNQVGDDDDLHAVISGDTEDRVKACIAMINKIIETATSVPEGQNELKRNQLRELAALNGTLRDEENQICSNCGAIGHRKFECPEGANFTSSLVCRICGGIGHIARDCLQKNDPVALQAANQRDQRLDDEYNNLMAELGGGTSALPATPWVIPDRNMNQWQASQSLGNWAPDQIEGAAAPPPPVFVPPTNRPAPPSKPAPPPKKKDN